METVQFLGLTCVPLKNEAVELLVTQSTGPRLIRLSLAGGDNLLAELPDFTLACPGHDDFKMWGGHRLWESPEVRTRTYLPDDRPVTITAIERGLAVVQPRQETGIRKSLRVTLPDESATVVVEHTLTNESDWEVELAAWAITMLRRGGVAILPHNSALLDVDGLLPNRRLNLWPYTDVTSPTIHWGNRYIFIEATPENKPLKIGLANPAGWLAYHLGDTLLVKQAVFRPTATYPDFGSNLECYAGPQFIELETLGPLTRLQPGESVTHRETWRLFANVTFEATEAAADALAVRWGL